MPDISRGQVRAAPGNGPQVVFLAPRRGPGNPHTFRTSGNRRAFQFSLFGKWIKWSELGSASSPRRLRLPKRLQNPDFTKDGRLVHGGICNHALPADFRLGDVTWNDPAYLGRAGAQMFA